MFRLLFHKSPNSFFSYYIFCCNNMFSVSFLSVSRLYFFFAGFLYRTCYCTVSTYFQRYFNILTCCQTNKLRKTGWKNNSCVTKEWKWFCLSCDGKDCKHYTFPFKIYKSLMKESRRLRTKCDWPQSCRHSWL